MSNDFGIGDIAPEAVLLAGAGRAILLQLANPAVGCGVARHSDFVADPLRRLHGTLSYIYALSNGTPKQRKYMQRQVQRAHLPVECAGAEGIRPYSAADPQLQLWVAATLYDSGTEAYGAVFPELSRSQTESVYRGYAVLGTALGMPAGLWPGSRAEFELYWESQLAALEVDDTVKGIAQELLAARNAPLWIRVLMPLARFLTIGMLPSTVRSMYGFSWSEGQDRMLRRTFKMTSVLVRITPKVLRHAPMRYYLKRIPG